ncbi:MAG TPA: class I fructose-bisphosphate aldolase [Candidatus Thermoplasmatota archaeon]|nr:class I fructose-bisphosphate aldolase [Candidatus Thermoplasmatota archaeon]
MRFRPLAAAMDRAGLESTAKSLVADRRGILAADESTSTITKRFEAVGAVSTETHRRDYRHLLFTAPGMASVVSGVILYDETLRQSAPDGTPLPSLLARQGVLPGIKVDTGAKDLVGFPGEKVTEGLDGLRERLAEYAKLGARFTKWRAVIAVGPGIPTDACIEANAEALARYAALAQEAGLVPIVEPEVLMDGDNTLEVCEAASGRALQAVFARLALHRVHLPGILLKPNMVIAGKKCPNQAPPQEVAERTVRLLKRHVPAAVPGIAFLSGGQTPEQATEHLRLMNRMGPHPWRLSFSYGRALQDPALKAWAGKPANAKAAQEAFLRLARANSAACEGKTLAEIKV